MADKHIIRLDGEYINLLALCAYRFSEDRRTVILKTPDCEYRVTDPEKVDQVKRYVKDRRLDGSPN